MHIVAQKKFYLLVFGCQMNRSDAERLASILKNIGYTETREENEADLIGIVACAVRQKAVDRIYGKIRNWQIEKEKRPLITMLSGCVLKQDREKLKDRFDLFIDIKKLDNLAEQIQAVAPEQKLALPHFFEVQPAYGSSYRAYVPIMTGCNKFCTYCAVPYTRGKEISRPAEHILDEVSHLLAHGYKEIVLLGQNVNSYGLDQDNYIKFPELLKKIDELGRFWLKFLTSHPYDMSDELIEVMANGKNISDYLHLPVQSGSDSMLQRMNRHYKIADYKKLINKVRERMPDIAISTDIIVGFCGETPQEFEDTKKLMKELEYNMSYISQYSVRSGTAADKMFKDDVSKEEKQNRWNIINDIVSGHSHNFNQMLIGQIRDMLIDTIDRNDPDKYVGKLSNYVAAHVKSNKQLQIGDFVKVKITKAMPWGVLAEIT